MSMVVDVFRLNFLLHNALWGSVAVGFFCPVVGVYFLLRRMTLLGVALPQISAAGISFAFFLEGLGLTWSFHAGESGDRIFALIGSIVFTLAALLVLGFLERRGEGTTESRLGAAYAAAYAAAILLVASNPSGKIELLDMLHGEIVSVNARDLHLLLGIYCVLGILLVLFKRQFVLVSFDRESARVLGKNVVLWDIFLYAIIGITLSISVLIVGPMVSFAFLIIPPLAVRRFCRRLPALFLGASIFGAVSGLIGFLCSYRWDLPLGPTDISVAMTFLFLTVWVRKTVDLFAARAGAALGRR